MGETLAGWDKVSAAVVAAVLAFVVAGGFLIVPTGPFEGWAYLALFATIPAAVLAPMPTGVRIFCGILALLGCAVTMAMKLSGPDNPLLVLPWVAISLGGAAMAAEVGVRTVKRMRRTILTKT